MRAWIVVVVVAGWWEALLGAGCTGRIILEDAGIEPSQWFHPPQ